MKQLSSFCTFHKPDDESIGLKYLKILYKTKVIVCKTKYLCYITLFIVYLFKSTVRDVCLSVCRTLNSKPCYK
jgi:hypothetical protein